MMLASDRRCAVITEYEQPKASDLFDLIGKLDLENADIVMVEGYRHLPFLKIELHRAVLGQKSLFPEDGSIIEVASDESLQTGCLPLLDLNEPEEVADFINCWLDKKAADQGKRAY